MEEIGRQILFWFSLHYQDIAVSLAAGALYDTLKLITSKLYQWQKQSWLKNSVRPAVVIVVNYHREGKSKSVTIYIDQEYSAKDIKRILSQAEIYEKSE